MTEQNGCESPERAYSALDLEIDIYDLNRMLRAAEFLQTEGGEEEIASSARSLVEQAAKMANNLHENFQANIWRICSKESA